MKGKPLFEAALRQAEKTPLGDMLGRAGRHLASKRQYHSALPEDAIFLQKEDFVPIEKTGHTSEIMDKALGKMKGGIFQHMPSGCIFMVKSPGVLNPTFNKDTKNTSTRGAEGRPVRNFVSRMEYAHGRILKKALEPFNSDFEVAPIFLVASKTVDRKVPEDQKQEHGYQSVYVASLILPLDEYPTKASSKAYGKRMEDKIMDNSGDTFMKMFFPSVLIADTDHPGPELANIGITKPDGQFAIFDFDVGTLNSPLKHSFMNKEVPFQQIADEMRNIKGGKVNAQDSHHKIVQANIDAGRPLFQTSEDEQSIPTNKISQQLYLRRFAVGDARIGIHLTSQHLADIFHDMSTPSPIRHTDRNKQRAKEQADYKAINQAEGIYRLTDDRLTQAHRLAAITHLMFPNVEDSLMPSAVTTVERYESLKTEIGGGRKKIESLPKDTKQGILDELIEDAGMKDLDREFKEMRKEQDQKRAEAQKKGHLKTSSLSRL